MTERDWPTYEQILFRSKIKNLIESDYTTKEICNFTGWCESTVQHYRQEYGKRIKIPLYPHVDYLTGRIYHLKIRVNGKVTSNASPFALET